MLTQISEMLRELRREAVIELRGVEESIQQLVTRSQSRSSDNHVERRLIQELARGHM